MFMLWAEPITWSATKALDKQKVAVDEDAVVTRVIR